MRFFVFGATGMLGTAVIKEGIDDPGVDHILTIGRRQLNITHDKVTSLVVSNIFDLSEIQDQLVNLDACYFCLGGVASTMSNEDYVRLTHDLPVDTSKWLLQQNPDLRFIYMSGEGADPTEKSRLFWARVRGKTENAVLAVNERFRVFRPGYIQPKRGVRTKVALWRTMYTLLTPLYPILRRLFPKRFTTSVEVGKALINVGRFGYPEKVLKNEHINDAATWQAPPPS